MRANSGASLFDPANLEAWYKFDANANDYSGNARNFNNPSSPAPTYVATGGKFSGYTKYMRQAGGDGQYNGQANPLGIDGGPCTFSMWVNMVSQPAAGVTYNISFQGKNTSNVNYMINYANPSTLDFIRLKQTSTVEKATCSYTLTTGRWFLLTMTYDNAYIRGYVDGVLVAGPTAASGTGASGNTGFYLSFPGALWSGGPAHTCSDMSCDELLVFSRTWSAAEVYNYFTQFGQSMQMGHDI